MSKTLYGEFGVMGLIVMEIVTMQENLMDLKWT